jgi:hypothetical protein
MSAQLRKDAKDGMDQKLSPFLQTPEQILVA